MKSLARDHRDWPLEVRFYFFTKKTKSCWHWQGAASNGKYGKIHIDEKTCMSASRAAYTIHKGPIPKGHFIRRTCGNVKCVNPDHLAARRYRTNERQ